MHIIQENIALPDISVNGFQPMEFVEGARAAMDETLMNVVNYFGADSVEDRAWKSWDKSVYPQSDDVYSYIHRFVVFLVCVLR
jgi:hypothetical protein